MDLSADLINLVKSLKKLDERKVIKSIHIPIPGEKYSHYKDVCALCEHPTGVGVHFADCPMELTRKIKV